MSETIDRQMSDIRELSQSQVPLDRVAPLHSNRLVTFVNHFIVSIVQQLNELSSVVDSRLFDINNQIIRCNTNLLILEMKLNSISGLSSVSPAVDAQTPQTTASTTDTTLPPSDSRSDTNITEQDMSAPRSDDSPQPEETNTINEISEEPEDPRLAKYKKMVQLGIPLAAVHQKMSLEGVDPQLLS